jgi:hypothetical protein
MRRDDFMQPGQQRRVSGREPAREFYGTISLRVSQRLETQEGRSFVTINDVDLPAGSFTDRPRGRTDYGFSPRFVSGSFNTVRRIT